MIENDSEQSALCEASRRSDSKRGTRLALIVAILLAAATVIACGDTEEAIPTLDPNPPITEDEAIEIAKVSLDEIIEELEFWGYDQIRVRVGQMRLRKLQELTESDLYTPDSPRMQRQIWAVQVGGKFEDDPEPYKLEYGYGIVGVDAVNGDIWLRARYDREILVEE